MSIEALHSQHSPKRRKLSHSSSNDAEATHFSKTAGTSSNTTGSQHATMAAGGINKSSILALQVADLNTEVTPNYDRLRAKWTIVSNRLQTIIKQMPSRAPVSAVDALKAFRKQGIKIPSTKPSPSKETNYKFEFQAPKEILVGGALPWGLSVKGDNVVQLTAIMPEGLLQEKDYLNNRAPHKAVFYLACIAAAIKEDASSEIDLIFAPSNDVDSSPTLEGTPKDKALSKFKFQISVGFPDEAIPIAKTLATKNCLRQNANGDTASSDRPTPFYNSSIRHAASMASFDKVIQSAKSPSYDEACRIGQIWLKRRGFSSPVSSGGFGFYEWALMCALFLRTGGHRGHALFSKQYTSLQFFKAMLQILAGRDLRDPMILYGANIDIPRSESPVLYDASTGVNVLYKMNPWSYQSLRHHAQVSLATINARNQDNFDPTFMLNLTLPVMQYDEVFHVTIPARTFATPVEQRQYLLKMHSTFVQGLGDRVSLIDFKLPPRTSWPLNSGPTLSNNDFELEVSLLINPDTATRLVDHGPSADEQEEAAEFRKFWGEKAELRRFKDGSISEALVWTSGTSVTLQIITHLLMLHFKLPPSSVSSNTPNLEATMLPSESPLSAKDAFRLTDSTFQTLTSTLHNLDGLPLPIRSIVPTDPALRSASVGNPLLPSMAKPIEFLVQFDSSTRWPDSLPAIQHTKIAFLLKLGELLTAQDPSLQTRVGLENTTSATTGYLNTSFLDMIYPAAGPGLSPVCFRARIHHEREEHLLQAALADKSLHGAVRDELAAALAMYKREFVAKPIHTSAIRSLCNRFAPLSGTIRLLKRWMASHLLLGGGHVPEEILEIVASSVFVNPVPWSVPGNSTTGFLRCLSLLARWDWNASPLVVDLGLAQDWSSEMVGEVKTRFEAWRKLDPVMNNVVWFVGTTVDGTGVVWTQRARPARVVAGRVSALAKAAVEMLESQGTGMSEENWAGLFNSPLGDFDFVIHVRPGLIKGRHHEGKKARRGSLVNGGTAEFKNLQIAEALDVESLGYDPVDLFLQDLNYAFGASALFFYDRHGGTAIAGLWRPSVLGRREWRVRLGWSSMPVPAETDNEKEEGKDICVFNKEGVLAEIATLGEGIVKNITTKE
ncbi:U3 snoRNP protein [Exophiala xenobiotica]